MGHQAQLYTLFVVTHEYVSDLHKTTNIYVSIKTALYKSILHVSSPHGHGSNAFSCFLFPIRPGNYCRELDRSILIKRLDHMHRET